MALSLVRYPVITNRLQEKKKPLSFCLADSVELEGLVTLVSYFK